MILPVFVREGVSEPVPTAAILVRPAHAGVAAGISGIVLFGVPEESKQDAVGTPGTNPDGILQVAVRDVRAEVGDELLVVSDLRLDETTEGNSCAVAGIG